MREKLNSNPLAQLAVVGVLLLVAGFFFTTTMGGRRSDDSGTSTETASTTVETPAGTASVTATLTSPTGSAAAPDVSAPIAAPPPPRAVTAAWDANRTVALLFVHNGGIDDRLVTSAAGHLRSLSGVTVFVVPAGRIYRYASIAQGVDVDRVPALVVLRPKRLDKGIPTASIHYGFQSAESIVQAVVDAGYKGRTVPYHP